MASQDYATQKENTALTNPNTELNHNIVNNAGSWFFLVTFTQWSSCLLIIVTQLSAFEVDHRFYCLGVHWQT